MPGAGGRPRRGRSPHSGSHACRCPRGGSSPCGRPSAKLLLLAKWVHARSEHVSHVARGIPVDALEVRSWVVGKRAEDVAISCRKEQVPSILGIPDELA